MSIVAGGMRKMMELLDKLSVPQIQQGMKAGRYPAYLAIPAIELKTRMQKQFEQQKLLQQPSPKETPTVAEQVMQEAQGMGSSMGAEIGAGVSGLPSNLPQEYAEGGVVALSKGGDPEDYMDDPASDMGGGIDVETELKRRALKDFLTTSGARVLDIATAPSRAMRIFGRDILGEPLRMAGVPIERAPKTSYGSPFYETLQRQREYKEGPPPDPNVTKQGDVEIRQMLKDTLSDVGGTTPPGAATGFGIPSIGGGGLKLTPVPAAFDYTSLIQGMPKKLEEAAEKAVKAEQERLDAYGKPVFEGRKARIEDRKKQIEKEAEVEKWLGLTLAGFKMAASKSPTVMGAVAEGGEEFVRGMVKSKAAQRLAREKLEDAQDNLDVQELADKKGNYQAAQNAGERAKRDVQYAAGLDMQARQATESGQFQRAQLARQGEIGAAQLQQQAASATAQLQLGLKRLEYLDKQIELGNKKAEALKVSATQKILADFNNSPEKRALDIKYKGKFDSVDSQRELQAARTAYVRNNMALALGSLGGEGATGARSATELLEE